ncbi:MAG TPA: NACHT domain-containing protein [Longimicrobium sp.]|nr:NACHT domain-containing protein [Longimicrobium sp.]
MVEPLTVAAKALIDLAAESTGERMAAKIFHRMGRGIRRLGLRNVFITLGAHRKDLVESLREMPFIYRDVHLDILKDFVAVQMTLISSGNERANHQAFDLAEKLRTKRRVVFLGNAGVGKTTFVRHTVLDVEEGGASLQYFGSQTDIVTFYVPLKAVDTSSEYPIVRYLLDHVRYLQGIRGLSRLRKLARQRRIFLLLDGYDEISFAGPESYVRNELSTLFAPDVVLKGGFKANRYRQILEELRNNRVWLTSRSDFFQEHIPNRLVPDDTRRPITDRLGKSAAGLTNVAILQVEGLGPKRVHLVRKIFARYEEQQMKLAPEAFLSLVDANGDEEVRTLSYNPLFLTVMCYVYAHQLSSSHNPLELVVNFDTIVRACIRLLLVDLDEGKARGVSEADRKLLWRNKFPEEKEEFLEYFAGRLFLDNKKLFTLPYLRRTATNYFERSNLPTRTEIMADLTQERPDDFAGQLVASGVFVIASRTKHKVEYDFPHRRFHEVLAADYFENVHRYRMLLEHVGEPQWQELVLFIFPKTSHADQIIRRLFELVVEQPDNAYPGHLVARCFQRKHAHFDAAVYVRDFLERRLADGRSFTLPDIVLSYLTSEPDWLSGLYFRFSRAMLKGSEPSLRLLCEITSRVNRAIFLTAIREFWTSPLPAHIDLRALVKFTAKFAPDLLPTAANALQDDLSHVDWLAYSLAKSGNDDLPRLERILDQLRGAARAAFLLRIERDDYGLFKARELKEGRIAPKKRGDPRSKEALDLPDFTEVDLAREWFQPWVELTS